jgi:hypothetical protein
MFANARAQRGDPRAVIEPSVCYELPVLDTMLDLGEVATDPLHPALVTDHQDQIAELFGQQGQVINGSIGIEHQFTGWEYDAW